ncbi:MAG: hypothetical protein PHF29_10190 [Candidatus Riflebacteria bacterium]|nr:hypothetical protein [Candidatus Riflebacteria bacterium]
MNKRFAMTFAEIMVAVAIVAGAAFPIFYLTNSSRKETTRAINYLRAVELANEVLEWASVSKYEELTDANMAAFTGLMTNVEGDSISSIVLPTTISSNDIWKNDNLLVDSLFYSDQYAQLYFYRDVKVEEVSDVDYIEPNMVKKVSVTVSWSEASRPQNMNNPSDRNRKLSLSVLILNDKTLTF